MTVRSVCKVTSQVTLRHLKPRLSVPPVGACFKAVPQPPPELPSRKENGRTDGA